MDKDTKQSLYDAIAGLGLFGSNAAIGGIVDKAVSRGFIDSVKKYRERYGTVSDDLYKSWRKSMLGDTVAGDQLPLVDVHNLKNARLKTKVDYGVPLKIEADPNFKVKPVIAHELGHAKSIMDSTRKGLKPTLYKFFKTQQLTGLLGLGGIAYATHKPSEDNTELVLKSGLAALPAVVSNLVGTYKYQIPEEFAASKHALKTLAKTPGMTRAELRAAKNTLKNALKTYKVPSLVGALLAVPATVGAAFLSRAIKRKLKKIKDTDK